MPRLDIEHAFEPVEIDLGGEVFVAQDVTKSKAKLANQILERLADPAGELKRNDEGEIDDDREPDDIVIALYGELFDLRFAAVEGKAKPSKVIQRLWEEDRISVGHIESLIERVTAARRAQQIGAVQELLDDRPT